MAGRETVKVQIELRGILEAADDSVLTSFLRSKKGRKLFKRVIRTGPGRELVRALRQEPGGTRALKALFSADMPKTRRKRAEAARAFRVERW